MERENNKGERKERERRKGNKKYERKRRKEKEKRRKGKRERSKEKVRKTKEQGARKSTLLLIFFHNNFTGTLLKSSVDFIS